MPTNKTRLRIPPFCSEQAQIFRNQLCIAKTIRKYALKKMSYILGMKLKGTLE